MSNEILSEEEHLKKEEEYRKEIEKNWGFFRKYISAEIEYSIYSSNENSTEMGKELLKSHVEEAYNKFMVAFEVRKPPKTEVDS